MKRRCQNVIVSLEDRQLVLNSEVIKDYPELEPLLQKYEKIYESDFTDTEDFTQENQSFLRYSFKGLVEEAWKEWFASYDTTLAVSDFREDWVTCTLCNTPNKYIFYIQNKMTGMRLNVGSDCIEKFLHLDSQSGDVSLDKIKKERVKEFNRLKRIARFNEIHPNALDKIKTWEVEYDNRPILMPEQIHEWSQALIKNMRISYNEYIESKAGEEELHKFRVYTDEYQKVLAMMDKHVEENEKARFICTREIKEWLQHSDYPNLINVIMKADGYLNEKTIKFIHYEPFVNSFLEDFKNIFNGTSIKLDKMENRQCTFSYKRPKSPYIFTFTCTYQELMKTFGHYLINPPEQIQEQEIIENILPEWERQNVVKLEDWLNLVLYKTLYKIEIDYDSKTIEYYDYERNQYAKGDATIFLKGQKALFFSDEQLVKERLIDVFTIKLRTWISIKEKEKFEFDDISKVTYGK